MEPTTNRELIEQGFESLHRRINDSDRTLRAEMLRMHGENILRLDQINGRVGKAYERISVLEEVTKTLKDEFQRVRDRWHEFRRAMEAAIDDKFTVMRRQIGGPRSSDEQVVTRKEIALILGLIGLGATVAIWILKH